MATGKKNKNNKQATLSSSNIQKGKVAPSTNKFIILSLSDLDLIASLLIHLQLVVAPTPPSQGGIAHVRTPQSLAASIF